MKKVSLDNSLNTVPDPTTKERASENETMQAIERIEDEIESPQSSVSSTNGESSIASSPPSSASKPNSSSNSNSSSSELSSISAPEGFDHILGEEEHLTQMDLIPDNYYLALSPDGKHNKNALETEEIMEMNRILQRRLVEQILKKKGKKIRPSEERRRKKLIRKMKKQFKNGNSPTTNPRIKRKKIKKEKEGSLEYQSRRENFMKQSLSTWRIKIIPHFEKVKTNNSTLRLWKKGLPPSVRGQVWRLSVGNETSRVSRPLFNILKNQKLEEKTSKVEETMKLIQLDLDRTFPSLQFFQKSGPYYHPFLEVLECWVKFRPDIGYIQGMSYLVGMMLLNMEAYDAFEMLSNLMTSKKYHFYRIFSMKRENMVIFAKILKVLIREKLPELYTHFENLKITLEVFVIDWYMTLFSKSFPLDIATHFWDLYLLPHEKYGGENFLFKATLGILLFYFPRLIRLEYDECMQFLSHVSEHVTEKDKFELMKAIGLIKLSSKQLEKARKEAEKLQNIDRKKEAIWIQKNRKRLHSYNKQKKKQLKKQKQKQQQNNKISKSLGGNITDGRKRKILNNKKKIVESTYRRRVQSDNSISNSIQKKKKKKNNNIVQIKKIVNTLKKTNNNNNNKKKKKKNNIQQQQKKKKKKKPLQQLQKKKKKLKNNIKKKKINEEQKNEIIIPPSTTTLEKNKIILENHQNNNNNKSIEEMRNSIKRRIKVTQSSSNNQ